MNENPLLALAKFGQSIWLDDIGRRLLADGSLARLISEDGLAGLTSNPAIFAKSITTDSSYATAIRELPPAVSGSMAVYETLVLEDLGRAAALLRPVYDASDGHDGFVSMEVSPHLAYDTAGTISEAQRLWARLDRPNVMIKIPGTEAGLAAIRASIAAGINVNVTLLFSPERYRAVAQAYFDGLEERAGRGLPVAKVASVASFFLSRIDTLVDPQLDALTKAGRQEAAAARGKAAVACACRAFEIFTELTSGSRWQALAKRGGRPQRLLWASTSAKDPTFSPVKYVEELIAPQTVNTLPLETIEAYKRLGKPEPRLQRELAPARAARAALAALGIDLETVAQQLESEGVRKFTEPFDTLQKWLEQQRR